MEPNGGCGGVNSGAEAARDLVVTRGNGAELLELGEEALDHSRTARADWILAGPPRSCGQRRADPRISSDPAMEEALHDIPVLRWFAGLDAGTSGMPDETTILNFRLLLEAHQLAQSLFVEVVSLLTERGPILREGTSVDATLIAAPPATKNAALQRDAEMASGKEGNQCISG